VLNLYAWYKIKKCLHARRENNFFLFSQPCWWKCDLFKGFKNKHYTTTCVIVLVIIIIHYGVAIIISLGNLKTYHTQSTIERIISEARSFIYNMYGKLTNRVKVFSVPELWTTCIRIAIFQNGKFKMFSCL